jgi:hypothetical protein
VTPGTTIAVAQQLGGGEQSTAGDVVDQLWGFEFFLGASTDDELSGLPVTSEKLDLVVGIHKGRNAKTGRNVAVGAWYVTEAIGKDIARTSYRSGYHTPSSACQLSSEHLEQLRKIKLDQIDELMFVSPASFGVSPIWFVRTCHSWFWTPTNPEEDGGSNWMRISPEDHLQVIGGYWNGVEPAPKNIRIIRYLQTNGDRFLFG